MKLLLVVSSPNSDITEPVCQTVIVFFLYLLIDLSWWCPAGNCILEVKAKIKLLEPDTFQKEERRHVHILFASEQGHSLMPTLPVYIVLVMNPPPHIFALAPVAPSHHDCKIKDVYIHLTC